MSRLVCIILLTASLMACSVTNSRSVELWSQPVYDGFGVYATDVKPVTIALQGKATVLAKASELKLEVVAYGSGRDIWVSLMIDESVKKASQADLMRTAMSAVMTFHQSVYDNSSRENRNVRANIYLIFTNSHEYNVLLATASLQSPQENSSDLTFPGPAWLQVTAVEKLPNALEAHYIQQMQLKRYRWGIEEKQEDMRTIITPVQDKEISDQMGIPAGSINLAPFVLKPIP